MSEQRFHPGYAVRLKSGGPKMTIAAYHQVGSDEGSYTCCWFDEKNQLSEGVFCEAELEPGTPTAAITFATLRRV